MNTPRTTSGSARSATGALLEAGAILLPGSHTGDDADTLTARTYTHPVLGERRVVRLVPGTLGEAEDLALDFLGLVREPDVPEVGQVRRETVGFPAWALINDPANGHHALALVKDIERLARMAKSRAGAAKDGFEQLGEKLGRSVPHFLPTFYEQAARIFLEHENPTYAATFFGKARQAEHVHGLEVDEARQRAVFLEFAFAGALTVKALKEHVKDLTRRLDPGEAWAQFRQLTVERCAAGMPPYASLPQDARALIRATGLDQETEERTLVAALLDSPAVVRAPGSFWKTYRGALVALARQAPGVRMRLLEIMPSGLGTGEGADETWLGLLADTGAEALLTGRSGAETVDAADWLSRWSAWRGTRRSPATYALVRRLAERLRGDGRPVDLFHGNRWRTEADPDLLDTCLAAGVPVCDPPLRSPVRLDLDRWLGDTGEGRQDLAAVAADPRFAPLLSKAVGELGTHWNTSNRRLAAVAAHPVLRGVLHDWLDARAEEFLRAGGLPAARDAVDRLLPFRPVATEVNPGALARVAGHGLAPLLARTLRAGIIDELGWPALEKALELTGAAETADSGPGGAGSGRGRDNWLIVEEAWPALIVAGRHKAVVAGPEGVLLEHDLRIPDKVPDWQRPHFRYADGELLVTWWHEGKQRAYWSARPAEVFTLAGPNPNHWYRAIPSVSLALPGGGRATGSRALHAGDTVLPEQYAVLSDGTGHWRLGRKDRRAAWLEYDPVTGTTGRASLPAFLASAAQEGTRLLHEHCELLPLLPGLKDTPLGTDGALLGRWVRTREEGAEQRIEAGTAGGRVVTLATRTGPGAQSVPLGALRLPGGAEPVLAAQHNRIALFTDGADAHDGLLGSAQVNNPGGEYAAGTPLVPPAPFWHALRPRDEQGSTALRGVTDDLAGQLIEAVVEAGRRFAADKKQAGLNAVSALEAARVHAHAVAEAVSRLLPAVTDPRLLAGVVSVVRTAVRLAEAVRRLVRPEDPKRPDASRERAMFEDYRPEHGDDRTLVSATTGLTDAWEFGYWNRGPEWGVIQQIRAVNHVLSGKPAEGRRLPQEHDLASLTGGWTADERTAPARSANWTVVLDCLRPLAYRAASPATADTSREALLLLLEALAEGPLCNPRGGLRKIVLCEEGTGKQRGGQVLRRQGRTIAILGRIRSNTAKDSVHWLALDHDPEGDFGPVAHFTLQEEHRFTTPCPADRLRELVRLVREKGAAPWRPGTARALAAAPGSGPAQAALLAAGLPSRGPSTRLPAETLALLGLQARQAAHAEARLNGLDRADRNAVLAALLPEDPAALWEKGPDTDTAVRVWTERLGSRLRLPEDTAVDLGEVPDDIAEAVLNPGSTPWLSRTAVQRQDKNGNLISDDPAAVPGIRRLTHAVAALAGLAYGLPYGDPLRAALPAGLAALRRRLADPGLLIDADISWTEKGPMAAELRKAYGLPEAGGNRADGLTPVGEALVLRPWYSDTEATLLRPAGLTGPDDPVFGLLEGLLGQGRGGPLPALRAALGDGLQRAVLAGLGPEDPPGYAQDPARTVPGLVAEVAAAHELGEDAAALYLQLLALPDPTDRNCARWTGWKPARMKRARAELAASGRVVEAKRSRAGRTLFLPGGWADLKAPALPLEIWKSGLYPLRNHARTLPPLPVPELFTRAWDRVRAGDGPAYEELTTRATRRGRRR